MPPANKLPPSRPQANVMLSRVAHSLYWMSRYIERAENIARLLEVNLQFLLDFQGLNDASLKDHWDSIILSTGEEKLFAEHYKTATSRTVTEFLAFDLRNPNKVRSVIGAFCNSNLIGFHQADGSGYRFLADYVIKLNTSNPQIASRQLTPLTRWRKYDSERQVLMKAELRRVMAEPKLSPDVFEVVSKSLQE